MAYELEYDLLTELQMVEGESAPEYVNVVAREARLEIERLRAAGDALHDAIRSHNLTEAHLKTWEEVRREQ